MPQNIICLSSFSLNFLGVFLCFLQTTFLDAQNELWVPISKQSLNEEKIATFKNYELFQLRETNFLAKIDRPSTVFARPSTKTLWLPVPTGKLELFEIIATPIYSFGAVNQNPSFQSFKVISKENPLKQGRINWTPNGFYGHLIENGQSSFIEKITTDGQEATYIVYEETALNINQDQRLVCGNDALKKIQQSNPTFSLEQEIEDTDLKVFRLAVTATEGFTNAVGGAIQPALSAIFNSVASLNVIYEKDLGIRFVLVQNNDQLVFTTENPSPFADSESAFGLWDEHTNLLDTIIGSENYDIGHVFAAECTGGVAGVAHLGGVCSVDSKANGVSCVFDGDIADFRKTLYHEIGHQLGANHTWSNCGPNVNDHQRHAPTAVEPGSGSTVMSYGGICGSFNIVATAQDNLHGISIQEIKQALASDTINCYQRIPTGNESPTVTVRESGFTIPIGTPFELDANAFGEAGSTLTYSWEQYDTGTISEVGFPIENAPSFRSFVPTRASKRVFPKSTNIILNNPSTVEVLPDTTRQLTFGVTVRDNQAGGGSTTFAKVAFSASAEAGPFTVLQPDSANIEYIGGDSIDVTWAVANTDINPVNCSTVDVLLSIDNGKEFTKILAANIPNNGQTKVVLPDTTTTRARVKVKCANNIFFDMSNNRFKIIERIKTATIDFYEEKIRLYPNPSTGEVLLEFPKTVWKSIDLTIFDALGRKVFDENVLPNNGLIHLYTNHLQNGVYLITGNIEDQIFSKRFIIQK